MEERNRRFTNDEVTSIIRRALDGRGGADDVTYDDLEDIAKQSGITPSRLRQAIEEQETLGELENARTEFKKRQRQEFFNHFRSYCIVNGALILINVLSSREYFWFVWPMVGWGIGIAFHAVDALFPNEAKIERGAKRLLRKQQMIRAKQVYDRIGAGR